MLKSLGDYFDKHYTIANSIVYTGSSIALVIFAPLTQLLMDTYGWRGTLLILGSISSHIALCGALLKVSVTDESAVRKCSSRTYQRLKDHEDKKKEFEFKHSSRASQMLQGDKYEKKEYEFKHYLGELVKEIFDPEMFGQPLFLACLATEFAIQYSWIGWVVYIVPYARSVGLSPYYAATISTAGGVGSLTGTIAIAFIQKVTDNLVYVTVSTLTIGGCALLIYPFSDKLHILLIISFVFGMTINVILIAVMVVGKSLKDDMSHVVAWIFFASSLGRLSAGFFTG